MRTQPLLSSLLLVLLLLLLSLVEATALYTTTTKNITNKSKANKAQAGTCTYFTGRNYTSYGVVKRFVLTDADECCLECAKTPGGACLAATFYASNHECQIVADASQFVDGIDGVVGILPLRSHEPVTPEPTPEPLTPEPTPYPMYTPYPTPHPAWTPEPTPQPAWTPEPTPPMPARDTIGVFSCCFSCPSNSCKAHAAYCGQCIPGRPWHHTTHSNRCPNLTNVPSYTPDTAVSHRYTCTHPITLSVSVFNNTNCQGFPLQEVSTLLDQCQQNEHDETVGSVIRESPQNGTSITRAACGEFGCTTDCQYAYFTSGQCTQTGVTSSVYANYFKERFVVTYQNYTASGNCSGAYTMWEEKANTCLDVGLGSVKNTCI